MKQILLKDKPNALVPARSPWRKRRNLAFAGAIFLICYWIIFGRLDTSNRMESEAMHPKTVDWSKHAYSQYATDQHYLCNSLMVFDSLEKLKSPADRLLFYPKTWDTDVSSSKDRISQLLLLARNTYHVKLRPVEMYTLKRQNKKDEETWDASINKLHAWNQAEYDRVIHLDSDISLLQNIDELFFLPLSRGAPIAMPRAYWLGDDPNIQHNKQKLSSLLIVLEPIQKEAELLWDMAAGLDNSSYTALPNEHLFDMELLNSRYAGSALTLPHRPYALVTGELRRKGSHNHTLYLGNEYELWDAEAALKEAKLIHFSDWPLPKPWIMWPNSLMREMRPECEYENGTPNESGCENRKVWMDLYDEFRKRRKDVCKLLSVPAPEWPPKPKKDAR